MMNQAKKLQSLQEAYASLCGLTLFMLDSSGRKLTDPSGPLQLPVFVLDEPSLLWQEDTGRIFGDLKQLRKPAVYENSLGMKWIVSPIKVKKETAALLCAGVWMDGSSKELAVHRISEAAPPQQKELWEQAAAAVPFLSERHVEAALGQIGELAAIMQCVMEREHEERLHASRLQLLSLVSLLDCHDPAWLKSILNIFVKVTELPFAGFALKSAEEQFVIHETAGTHEASERLLGVHFYTGEGLLGQVALSKEVGYWEEMGGDPRAALFTARGMDLQMLICYPVKYGDELYGLLFGGSSMPQEMSEELADVGGLLARQAASDFHHKKQKEQNDWLQAFYATVLDIAGEAVDAQGPEPFVQSVGDIITRNVSGSLSCLLMREGPFTAEAALERADEEMARALIKRVSARLHPDSALAFRKPKMSEWNGWQLYEVPLANSREWFGVLAVAVPQGDSRRLLRTLRLIGLMITMKLDRKQLSSAGCASGGSREEALLSKLTSRESEVLQHVMQGLSNVEIAGRLYISAHTVKNHITKIYEKLGVSDRNQALVKYFQSSIGTSSYRNREVLEIK